MRFILVALALILAAPAYADDCRPIFVLAGMEGGGKLPQGKAGWYILRAQALGIPVPQVPAGCDALARGEAPPMSRAAMQLCLELRSAVGVHWAQLPGVVMDVSPDWHDKRGALDKLTGRDNWQPSCEWAKAREWITNSVCKPKPDEAGAVDHYAPCRRFPGACAVRIPTATWAKHSLTDAEGKPWFPCTAYAEIWALNEPEAQQ